MKKILLGMALAIMLVWGFGVQSASATYITWTPTDLDTNTYSFSTVGATMVWGAGDFVGMVDDSVDLVNSTPGEYLTLVSSTVSFALVEFNGAAPNTATLASNSTSITLGSTDTFQLGYFDNSSQTWSEAISYFSQGANGYEVVFANGDIFQVDGIPSTVPIPAAIWLLGSGLLGMVGIRRRSKRI